MAIDLPQARATLEQAVARTADLLASIPDGGHPVSKSDWTIGEVGAHLVWGLRAYTDAARGSFDVIRPHIPQTEHFRDRLSGTTAATLSLLPERHPGVLSTLLVDAAEKFLAVTDRRALEEHIATPWYGSHTSLSLAASTCLLTAEQIVHGYDIATTLRRRWPISRADVLIFGPTVAAEMIPKIANPATARGHTASYELRLRGGPRLVVHFRDGTPTVEPGHGQPVDCHLSAEPVNMLLVMYGRISQWGPIARGQLLTWGRKPWLALSLKDRFFNP